MPDSTPPSSTDVKGPNYVELIQFLVHPFLESPDSLKVDCEFSPRTMRVLIRLAFDGEDKGRVFGRGGRNIQAIRTIVQAAAQTVGQLVHIEIYGGQSVAREASSDGRSQRGGQRPQRRRPPKNRSS